MLHSPPIRCQAGPTSGNLCFALLPVDLAVDAFIFCHFLLASVSMYALARTMGLRTSGALLAGCAYAYSGFFQFNSVAAQPYVGVAAWLPVALLGTESAIRADHLGPRVRGWALSGLALSRVARDLARPGELLRVSVFAVWTCSRAIAIQPRATVMHLGVPLLMGVGLDAAGVLPRAWSYKRYPTWLMDTLRRTWSAVGSWPTSSV